MASLLDRFSQDTIDALLKCSSMKGILKKKRDEGNLLSKVASSQERYFRFFCMGKFLTYFEKAPVG